VWRWVSRVQYLSSGCNLLALRLGNHWVYENIVMKEAPFIWNLLGNGHTASFPQFSALNPLAIAISPQLVTPKLSNYISITGHSVTYREMVTAHKNTKYILFGVHTKQNLKSILHTLLNWSENFVFYAHECTCDVCMWA